MPVAMFISDRGLWKLLRSLIIKTKCDFVTDGKFQSTIIRTPHKHEEEGHMGVPCIAIAVKIQTSLHLVSSG